MGRYKLRFMCLERFYCTFAVVSLMQIRVLVLEIRQACRRTDRRFLPWRFHLIYFVDKTYKHLFQVPSPWKVLSTRFFFAELSTFLTFKPLITEDIEASSSIDIEGCLLWRYIFVTGTYPLTLILRPNAWSLSLHWTPQKAVPLHKGSFTLRNALPNSTNRPIL
jgi:hypothetical protein